MSKTRIYLDHNATTPLKSVARQAMLAALDETGNASSVHGEGRDARARIEMARRGVAELVEAEPKNVVFTSGGTEANVTALTLAYTRAGEACHATRLFVTAVEHASVLGGGRVAAPHVATLPVDGQGVVDLDQAAAMISGEAQAGGVPLVAVMAANNETGVLQPIPRIAEIVHAAGGHLFVDAVQAAGRMHISLDAWGADVIALSSHKIGGPQGAGALVYAGDALRAAPLLNGGGQEDRRRAGTENVAAIAGFGAAALAARDCRGESARLRDMRDWLEAQLTHIRHDTAIFARDAERLPNTTSFAVPGLVAETALIGCDLAGVAMSSGSACSSGKVAASHVLEAMGVSDALARGAVRVSLGWTTQMNDIERFTEIWRTLMERMSPATAGRAA